MPMNNFQCGHWPYRKPYLRIKWFECPFLPLVSVFFWGVATRRKICCLQEWRWLRRGLSPTTHAALVVERAATSLKKHKQKHKDRWLHKPWETCNRYMCLYVNSSYYIYQDIETWNELKESIKQRKEIIAMLNTLICHEYLVYICVYLLFGSGQSFSWTGARNGNFRKLGTEEEEWRRARRPPSGLRWRDGSEKRRQKTNEGKNLGPQKVATLIVWVRLSILTGLLVVWMGP